MQLKLTAHLDNTPRGFEAEVFTARWPSSHPTNIEALKAKTWQQKQICLWH